MSPAASWPARLSPPTICDLSNVRAAVADAKALVDKGDLAAARTRLKDLDKFWDGTVASSSPQTVARWRVIDRAIDRGLDRYPSGGGHLAVRACVAKGVTFELVLRSRGDGWESSRG